MLDAFIIEQVRRREQERKQSERPFVRLPVDGRQPERYVDPDSDPDTSDRGVVVVDL